jgi:hypothetical protein
VVEEAIRAEIDWMDLQFTNAHSQSMSAVQERKVRSFPYLVKDAMEHRVPIRAAMRLMDKRRQVAINTDLDPWRVFGQGNDCAFSRVPNHVFVDASVEMLLMNLYAERVAHFHCHCAPTELVYTKFLQAMLQFNVARSS